MKSIKYFFLLIPIIVMYACVSDEDMVFDDLTAIRMQKTIEEYKSLLVSAPNGWIMNYYPEINYAAGGFAMYYKFHEDGNADIACEIATNKSVRTIATSSWDVIPYQGPVITFETYNPVLHYFSEVSSTSDRDGRAGDYEFVITKATQDSIYLQGLKNSNKIVMWKADADPLNYLKQCSDVFNKANKYKNFNLILNGDSVARLTMSSAVTNNLLNRKFTVNYVKETEEISQTISFAFTPTGILLNTDLVVNNVTMRNFSYDDDERTYTCTDPGTNVQLVCTDGEIISYDAFLGNYTMYYATSNSATTPTRSLNVSLVKEQEFVSYRLEGVLADDSQGKIIVNYLNGNIQLLGQIISVLPGTNYDFWFLPYSVPSGGINYTSRSTTVGMISSNVERIGGKLSFKMVDNGVWATYTCAGFMLRNYNGSTNVGNVNGKDGQPYYFIPSFSQQ